jgi:thymidylate kinase
VGKRIADEEISRIRRQDFDGVLKISGALAKSLKSFCFRKNAIGTLLRAMQFYLLTFNRLILQRRKYIKSFSVMAPDGAGKTTFLDALIEEIGFYFTKDSSLCDIYHFRPQLFPNLGAVGGKTGMMKPDTNYNEPHRAKPAGRLSSLLRLSYYWLDYVVGWYSKTLKDIQYDKFTVFDRYAYDLIVDPHRTRLNLPRWVRMLYVKLMPEPRVSFYIDVEPGEIYRRKQELQPEEIVRQVKEYRRLAKSNKRIITIDGNRSVDEMVKDAIQVILDNFANRCD